MSKRHPFAAFVGRAYHASVIRRPLWVLLILFGLTFLALAGLPKFKLDASADALTLEHDTSLDYLREINQRYQRGDFLVVTFSTEGDLFSEDTLLTLHRLRDDLAKVAGVDSVNSILDVPLLYSPKQGIASQGNTRTLLTPGVNKTLAKQEFLTSPLYRNMLLSPNGKTTALLLNLAVNNQYLDMVRLRDSLRSKDHQQLLTADEQRELKKIEATFLEYRTAIAAADSARIQIIRQIASQYRPQASVYLGGLSMITSDMLSYIQKDLIVFGAALIIFIVAVLGLIFRQWRFVVLPLATCLITVALMLGWLSWIDWRLTVISSNFVALLLIMAFAFTIYIVVRYREEHQQHPHHSQAELVMATAKHMAAPCLFSALTTITAFMSLVMSGIRPVIDFGWMMTIGLVVAFILSFVVVPAGLMLLPKGKPPAQGASKLDLLARPLARITQHFGGSVIAISVLLAAVSVVGLSRLDVENRFIDYFHPTSEIHKGLSVIDTELGGTASLDIILDADEATTAAPSSDEDPFAETPANTEDPFSNPEDPAAKAPNSYWFTKAGLEKIQRLHQYLESLPEVGKVQSLAMTYQLGKDLNGAGLSNFELTLLRKALPENIQNFLIAPYLSDSHQQTRITLRIKETTPNLKRADFVQRIKHHALSELGFKENQLHFTGMLILYNNMLASLFESQISTIFIVFIAISVMMLALFRSVSIAFIAIIPNILAAGIVLGGMGLAGIPLDMMTTTLAAIVVGVGVDQAIQYIYRFKEEFAKHPQYLQAMHRSHTSIGQAMYYSSATIIIGFSILALSQFIPTVYFGVLTAFAMFTAIVGTLTLLPKLLLILKPFGPEKPKGV